MVVFLGVALGVGLARYGSGLPLVGSLLGEKQSRTTTGPVVVEGIRELDRLVERARLRAVGKIAASARENGILDTADQNAQNSIRAFVTTLEFEKVRFE